MKSTQATLTEQNIYRKEDALALPHYKIPSLFVIPGGKHCTVSQLTALGFVPDRLKLWERDYDNT
jgi:hypothetical protein